MQIKNAYFKIESGFGALIVLSLLCLGLSGCASRTADTGGPADFPATIQTVTLREALLALGTDVAFDEAYRVAETATRVAHELAQEYRVGDSAFFHNVLVNAGVRDRGLCYHWAEDMEATLNSLSLYTLDIRRVISRENTLREHNAVVVTAKDQPIGEGIVLDGWRDPGKLYWGTLSQDKYPWQEKFPRSDATP
jgi:hypothetical protein